MFHNFESQHCFGCKKQSHTQSASAEKDTSENTGLRPQGAQRDQGASDQV